MYVPLNEQCLIQDADSFIHSGHFYSAPSSPLLLRGAPVYSMDTVSEFHAEAHRQLQVQDLPKVLTWRLERDVCKGFGGGRGVEKHVFCRRPLWTTP